MKGWKKIFDVHGEQKKAGEEMLISGKIDFEIKAVKRDIMDTTSGSKDQSKKKI